MFRVFRRVNYLGLPGTILPTLISSVTRSLFANLIHDLSPSDVVERDGFGPAKFAKLDFVLENLKPCKYLRILQ